MSAHHSVMREPASRLPASAKSPRKIQIPSDVPSAELDVDGGTVTLTNLNKPFWPEDNLTKRDLLQYYADISPFLLPHLVNRAMVMKRYPDGAYGKFFFQKRAPDPRPQWIPICEILHPSANLVDFPVIQNLAGLLWVVNLGCIDLNPWYARCDDVDRPDYLHFDLDPTPGAEFKQVLEATLVVRDALAQLKIPELSKNNGIARHSCLYSDRARTAAKRGLDVRQISGERTGEPASGNHYCGVPGCKTARAPRARRLQPERLGPHACVGLLRTTEAARDSVRASDMGRSRTGNPN